MGNLIISDVKGALENNNGEIKKAANELNSNYQTVYAFIKRHGLSFACSKITLSVEQVSLLYKDLGSLSKVAKSIGVTKEGVRNFMQRNNLKIKDPIKYSVNHDFFKYENERSLYWAGFLAADGSVGVRKNSYFLSLGLSSKDYNHIEKFKKDIDYNGPIRRFMVKNSKRNASWNDCEKSEIKITSRSIFDDLSVYNIVPRKTHIYTFPEHLKENPLVHHFIRGYVDGDGSWYWNNQKKKSQMYFCVRGTVSFLESCKEIIEDNINRKTNKKIRLSNGIGKLEYGGNGVSKKIAEYLYKDAAIYLDRKHNLVNQM